MKQKLVTAFGSIEKILGNNNYLVKADLAGKEVSLLCGLSGRMRQFEIGVIVGDPVTIELSPPFDRGRITYRGHKEPRK